MVLLSIIMKACIWFCFFFKNAVIFALFLLFFNFFCFFLLLFFWLYFVTRPFPGMLSTLQYQPTPVLTILTVRLYLLAEKEEALSAVPTNVLNKVTEQQAPSFHLRSQNLWHHILKMKGLIFKDFHNSQESLLKIFLNPLMTLNKTFSIMEMQKKIFRNTNKQNNNYVWSYIRIHTD